jgi:hypothetical protein
MIIRNLGRAAAAALLTTKNAAGSGSMTAHGSADPTAAVMVTVRSWCLFSGTARVIRGRADVAGELLAVGAQGDCPVRAGAQERDAGDGFELADLAGQDGVPDAELAGGVVEAGLPGEREEPADALFGVRAVKAFQMAGGNAPGAPMLARGWARAAHAVPDGDAGVAGRGGEGPGGDAGFGGDVLEAALP